MRSGRSLRLGSFEDETVIQVGQNPKKICFNFRLHSEKKPFQLKLIFNQCNLYYNLNRLGSFLLIVPPPAQ